MNAHKRIALFAIATGLALFTFVALPDRLRTSREKGPSDHSAEPSLDPFFSKRVLLPGTASYLTRSTKDNPNES